MGLFTLVLGLSMSIKSSDFILMFLSLVFGTMYGEYCSLDKSITNFTEKIKIKINVKDAKIYGRNSYSILTFLYRIK